ncbi:MAG: hypothetical protein P9X24_12805 [Candidatus Hatepunaea meridiana]|nr:hypothetical protein [Candidatus Hatepunaea meridiana]
MAAVISNTYRWLLRLCMTVLWLLIFIFPNHVFSQDLEVPSKPKTALFKPSEKKKYPKKFCKKLRKILNEEYKNVRKNFEEMTEEFREKKSKDDELPKWQLDETVIWEEDRFLEVHAPHPSPDGKWMANLLQSFGTDVKTTVLISDLERTAQFDIMTSSELIVYYNKRRSAYCFSKDAGLAWSPNGKILAFTSMSKDQLDLYFLAFPVTKKDKMKLWQTTKDEANEFQPVFSPTNEYFAYVSNARGVYNVCLVNLDRWHVSSLTGDAGTASFSPDFHPEERQIAFVREKVGVYSIVIRDLKSDDEKVVVDGLSSPYIFPTWSHDGELLAYHDGESIKSVDLSREVVTLCNDALSLKEHKFVDRIAWLPNSEQVIYTRIDKRVKTLYVSMNEERGILLTPASTTQMLHQTKLLGKTVYYGAHEKHWKIFRSYISLYIPKVEDISTHANVVIYKACFTGKVVLKGVKKKKLKDLSKESSSTQEIDIAEIKLIEPTSVSEENIIELIETDEKKHFNIQISLKHDEIVNKKEIYVRLNSRIAKPKRKLTVSYTESAVGGGPGGAIK